jgi:membrane protein DedA with SNARE-associated domain
MGPTFARLAGWYAAYGYPVLFLGVLLENAGLPVPGETAILLAGFLASPAGGGRFNLGTVIAVAFVAAVLGDNAGFWLGRRLARPRLQRGHGFLALTPAAMRAADGYFERYGIWTVVLGRFVTGLRVIVALAAGTAGMPWPRFFPANAVGAFAWASTASLLGYFFGRSWHLLHHWLSWGSWVMLGSAALVVMVVYVYRKWAGRRRQTSSHEVPESKP